MNETRLLESMQQERAPHAILIVGPEGSGRFELAKRICASYCLGDLSGSASERVERFPDYRVYTEQIKIATVREIEEDVASGAFALGRRAFVLRNAHKMSLPAQNALLKTLEEPPDNTLFVLTGNEDGIIPTICSRCVIWRMGAGDRDAILKKLDAEGFPGEKAELAVDLSDGIEGLARKMLDSEFFKFREEVLSLVEDGLFGVISYGKIPKLLQAAEIFEMEIPRKAPDEMTDEEEIDEAEEKKRIAKSNLPIALSVFASVMRDAFALSEKHGRIMNRDHAELIGRIVENFTKTDILDMMNRILETQKNMVFSINANLAVESIMTYMLMIRERKQK